MSWRHDMTSWRHFVTCKTISGANQHINLITNSFPGFYYTGRSLCHFTTCCRQPMTSWHDFMTSSWHVKLYQALTSWHAMLLQALLDIEILSQMWIRDSTTRVSQWSTWHTWYKNVMTSCHDVTCKTISGTNQHINLIPNLFPGFYYMGRSLGHFTTCCRQPLK